MITNKFGCINLKFGCSQAKSENIVICKNLELLQEKTLYKDLFGVLTIYMCTLRSSEREGTSSNLKSPRS